MHCASKRCNGFGEQGWRSGESARLPPMCPGFDSRTQRLMWVELVVGSLLCSKRFSPGTTVFPLLENQHFHIPIRSWDARTFLNEFLWTHWCSVGKQITNYIYIWVDFVDTIQTCGFPRCSRLLLHPQSPLQQPTLGDHQRTLQSYPHEYSEQGHFGICSKTMSLDLIVGDSLCLLHCIH